MMLETIIETMCRWQILEVGDKLGGLATNTPYFDRQHVKDIINLKYLHLPIGNNNNQLAVKLLEIQTLI